MSELPLADGAKLLIIFFNQRARRCVELGYPEDAVRYGAYVAIISRLAQAALGRVEDLDAAQLPEDLASVGDERLRAWDAGLERRMIKWVRRLRDLYPAFDQTLADALRVEDEIARRDV